MKCIATGLIVLALGAWCVDTHALYVVSDTGQWPESWPAELEPLREQAETYIGPMIEQQQHVIRFADREAFEAAWPHLLKVKSAGAPVILRRGPHTWAGTLGAGVRVHCPPADTDRQVHPEAPTESTSVGSRWMWTNYIELIVDGEVVDLNRIPLPPDTPIIDLRFVEPEPIPQLPEAESPGSDTPTPPSAQEPPAS